jgi:hypothetical protein
MWSELSARASPSKRETGNGIRNIKMKQERAANKFPTSFVFLDVL